MIEVNEYMLQKCKKIHQSELDLDSTIKHPLHGLLGSFNSLPRNSTLSSLQPLCILVLQKGKPSSPPSRRSCYRSRYTWSSASLLLSWQPASRSDITECAVDEMLRSSAHCRSLPHRVRASCSSTTSLRFFSRALASSPLLTPFLKAVGRRFILHCDYSLSTGDCPLMSRKHSWSSVLRVALRRVVSREAPVGATKPLAGGSITAKSLGHVCSSPSRRIVILLQIDIKLYNCRIVLHAYPTTLESTCEYHDLL